MIKATTNDIPALLEIWMRRYYFDTEIDIGSSGVESYTMGELRGLLDITQESLDALVFDDSRTQGGEGLRRAIAARWGEGDARRVMATHGSSEAIYLVMNALLGAGDEVVALDPAYPQLSSTAEAIGCRMKPWPLRFESGFVPDIADAARLIGPRTRMVVVNFPHNPTGASLTPAQQQQLLGAVSRVGAYLVWDAAFGELVYEGEPLCEPGRWYEKSISLGTLSKAYGLPGLRAGWMTAPPEVIERCIHLRDYITLHLSPLVELIAERAVEHADRLLAPRLRQARENLGLVAEWVGRQEGAVEWARPWGGVCAFLRLPRVRDVEAFCHRLAREHKVLLVPGSCFNHPGHVRLGFGGARASLEEGLRRFSHALAEETGGREAHHAA